MDCSPPGSSVHGILQARILEWVAISFSRGSSRPKDWTHVSCLSRQILYNWATQKPSEHQKHKFMWKRSGIRASNKLTFSTLAPHHYVSLPPPLSLGAVLTVIVSRSDEISLPTISITSKHCQSSPKEGIPFYYILYIPKGPTLKVCLRVHSVKK